MFRGAIATFAPGIKGLTGTKAISREEASAVSIAKGVVYRRGIISKEGGASPYTSVPLEVGIQGGYEWRPAGSTQYMVIVDTNRGLSYGLWGRYIHYYLSLLYYSVRNSSICRRWKRGTRK